MRLSLCAILLWMGAHFAPTEALTSPSSLSTLLSINSHSHSQSIRSPSYQNNIILKAVDDNESFVNEDDLRDAGPPKEYLATCIPGLAPYLEEELLSCGVTATDVLSNAAVSFTIAPEETSFGDDNEAVSSIDTIALKALIWVRTAHRILEKIDSFYDIESRDDVYHAIQNSRLHVKDLLGDGQGGLLSLSVKVIANGRLPKDISHSHYTALTIKNALVDQVRDLREDGERPNVDLDDPDVPLVAILHSTGMGAEMSLYRSLAPPGSLHRRGYRSGGPIHKAAMKESMAAGLLIAAGWKEACDNLRTSTDQNDEGLTLIDPMCGSGSLLLEAAMMAVDFAPGLMRVMNGVPGHQIPPVLRWKGNKDTLVPIWKEMMMDASQRVKHGVSWLREHDRKIEIIGNDLHGGALELVESSLADARGLERIVDLHQNDCRDWKIAKKEERENQQIWVMTNPPWGVRLSDDDHESWESLRIFLRENCPGGRTQAWVLSGNKSSTKHLGLRRSQSIPLKTGQQDLRWIKYVMEERIWTESSRHETTTHDLNGESTEENDVPVAPISAQLDRVAEKAAIPERKSVHTAPTAMKQERAEQLPKTPGLRRDSDEPSQERVRKTEERNAKPISPALDLEQSKGNQSASSREPTNVKSYAIPPPREYESKRPHIKAPGSRESQPKSPQRGDKEEQDSRAPRQESSASSSGDPAPAMQRDDQKRLIRTRAVNRSPSPTTSTLQRDDQQRLIRVRSSPGTSRVPAGNNRARKSTTSGDDSWS